MERIKVILVDDHTLFRKGLKMLLDELDGVEVVGEASTGKEFLMILEILQPDVVLMDINMPEMNGMEATQIALKLHPSLSILMLSMHGEEEYFNKMVDAGVKGFLLKNAEVDEVIKAINTVYRGGSYFSQELLLGVISGKNKKHEDEVDLAITERELEVLRLICLGYSNVDIGDKLFISPRTVDRHRSNLLEKTNSRNSVALVMYAIKHKLVEVG
jgi:DNA-binding NarL/FixJ family response regulator